LSEEKEASCLQERRGDKNKVAKVLIEEREELHPAKIQNLLPETNATTKSHVPRANTFLLRQRKYKGKKGNLEIRRDLFKYRRIER